MSRKKAIDTHVHFWEMETYQPFAGWFQDRQLLARDYLPTHLEPDLIASNVESVMSVGAAPNSQAQNQWYGELVSQYESVCAVVGSYTFDNEQLPEILDTVGDQPWFVGIRAKPTAPPESWTTDAQTRASITELRRHHLTLDILVDHTLLPAVGQLAATYDDLPIILNHCGLPPFRDGDLRLWASNMIALAEIPNIFVKYSSFFLHCHPVCKTADLQAVADIMFEHFSVHRLLWGSNWPPELVGGTYEEAYTTMFHCAGQLSDDEYNLVFRENAQRVYGLHP